MCVYIYIYIYIGCQKYVQSNFRDETRGKIISGVFKYPNVHIWTSNTGPSLER